MTTTRPDRTGGPPRWNVGCRLDVDVTDDATIVLQVAPAAGAGTPLDRSFDVTLDGRPIPSRTLHGDHGAVVEVVRSRPGALAIDLRATLDRTPSDPPTPADDLDEAQITYLRQSRYCPSDLVAGFAAHELGHLDGGHELVHAVGEWVHRRLAYEEGVSGPLYTAVDALFSGRGVCRDFAHLAVTMLRALGVPARLVSVYASGLSPMDFHAVVEAHVGGRWWLLDPTRLAPRNALVRIATGRDAADAAFMTVTSGAADLRDLEVTAVTDGDLPIDDHRSPVWLA